VCVNLCLREIEIRARRALRVLRLEILDRRRGHQERTVVEVMTDDRVG